MRNWPALALSGFRVGAPTDLVQAALVGHDVVAIDEGNGDRWLIYFGSPAGRDAAASALAREFPSLSIEWLDVPDDDWAARSQASLTHVRVGGVIVAPPWDVPDKAQGAITIVIQPSMGFGTGHHATTRLCLAALQELDLRGRTVIDVGTGSGVLAIAASLLGAATAVGIDDDPDAIQAAQENLALNAHASVTFVAADVRAVDLELSDVVLANLTGALLVSAATRLQALVAPEGTLILSGLMEQEEHDVRAAFAGFEVGQRDQEDEWLCLRLGKRASRFISTQVSVQ